MSNSCGFVKTSKNPENFDANIYEEDFYGIQVRYGEPVCSWLSYGKLYLDEFITSNLEKVLDGLYGPIDETFIHKAINWAEEEIKTCSQLIPARILKSYTSEFDKVKTLTDCAGIEVIDTYGNRSFFSSEYDYIYIPDKNFDEDKRYILESFIKNISSMPTENIYYFN